MTELSVFLRHAKRSNQKQLDLSKRQLTFIPRQVFSIRSIEQLNLANNKISHIDAAISQLFRLKTINLQSNVLIDLPEQLLQLSKLTVLLLKDNPLSLQFQKLLGIRNNANMQDVLQQCFENAKQLKCTPHWLEESQPKVISKSEKQIKWDTSIFKPQTVMRTYTSARRNTNNNSMLQSQPESQMENGVLVINMKDLQIGQQISMGGFSTIHKGKYFQLSVAIKKVFNPNINEDLINEFSNQVKMLAKYRHPNIILMLGAISSPPQLCLVMQLIKQGTLFDLLHKRKQVLSVQQKTKIARQLIGVIAFLHHHDIVHRDIKSHNILIDRELNVKLCDFGLARHKTQLNCGPMQFSGTPTYMAQELFQKKAYNQSVDVFALGTLLYQLYAAQVPYHGLDASDIKDKLLKDSNLTFKIIVKKQILELINRCRSAIIQQRPTCSDLLKFKQW